MADGIDVQIMHYLNIPNPSDEFAHGRAPFDSEKLFADSVEDSIMNHRTEKSKLMSIDQICGRSQATQQWCPGRT